MRMYVYIIYICTGVYMYTYAYAKNPFAPDETLPATTPVFVFAGKSTYPFWDAGEPRFPQIYTDYTYAIPCSR